MICKSVMPLLTRFIKLRFGYYQRRYDIAEVRERRENKIKSGLMKYSREVCLHRGGKDKEHGEITANGN